MLSQLSYGPTRVLGLCANQRLRVSLVGLGGLEPPTSPLSGVRSNHLSYRPGRARLLVHHLAGVNKNLSLVPGLRAFAPLRLANFWILQVSCVGAWQSPAIL